ncbi:MAG: BamA/TamA family outer membrane protein [Deltaproteobacteria bacterium]|nr:BamA/TamA family outer membrane protein [Deltaproteobacteria bacterium]
MPTLLIVALGLTFASPTNADDSDKELDPDRLEWAALPAVAGNSDLGFIFGGLLMLAKFDEEYRPYHWRGQAITTMSLKDGPEGAEIPFHNHFITLNFPQVLGSRARLYANAGFFKTITGGYYGLGNDSNDSLDGIKRRNQYRLMGPYANLAVRAPIVETLTFFVSAGFRHSFIDPYAGSKLDEDSMEPLKRDESIEVTPSIPPTSRAEEQIKVLGTSDHARIDFSSGIVFDTRNDETNPRSGSYNEISLRGSPGAMTATEHLYFGLNAQLRHYLSIYDDYLVLAGRLTLDVLYGRVPFYELAKVGGLQPYTGFGGHRGVRGIPAGRYHGKVKAIGSLSLRSMFYRFKIKTTRFALGTGIFIDAGRLWADTKKRPDLDGKKAGIKFGTGGGVRLLWGKTFLICVDVAYSPDANPIGFYVDLGHGF